MKSLKKDFATPGDNLMVFYYEYIKIYKQTKSRDSLEYLTLSYPFLKAFGDLIFEVSFSKTGHIFDTRVLSIQNIEEILERWMWLMTKCPIYIFYVIDNHLQYNSQKRFEDGLKYLQRRCLFLLNKRNVYMLE